MVRRLRLITGLILFAYVTTHLMNHALGLVSLDALAAGRSVFMALWRNPPVNALLFSALIIHVLLAFWAIYQRRGLKMPPWELVQLILGLLIPLALVLHILGTRIVYELFGTDDSYIYVLLLYFVERPELAVRQFLLVLVVWTHGCIGMHLWLRLKPFYPPFAPYALVAAVLLPALALTGILSAGRQVMSLAADPAWRAAAEAAMGGFPEAAQFATIERLNLAILAGLLVLLVLSIVMRGLRRAWERRHELVRLVYPNGRRVSVRAGTSILDASRWGGIPHASVCGGRGRCSTCRVRVGRGREELTPPSIAESRVLARIGAAPDVRLACQTRPCANLEVTPLLPPSVGPEAGYSRPAYLQGQERQVVILFADLRGFTSLSEHRLPYDVVFILNRYFAAMGSGIEQAGGRVDKFIGDGVMALFGVDVGIAEGSRQALRAVKRMAEQLEDLNRMLAHDLPEPLRIGIGLHSGAVIVGEMGYGKATGLTAIGDAVNTASRLEAQTKELKAQLLVSERVVTQSELDLSAWPLTDVVLRGRAQPLAVRVIDNAANLILEEKAVA